MSPERAEALQALDRLAPEVLPGLRILPVVHGRIEMAGLVRAVLDCFDPAAVAVELPTTFTDVVEQAVARLPRVSLIVAPGEGEGPGGEPEEAVVWTAAPGEPFAEALRWAAERDRERFLVDPDVPYPERHTDPVPDPYALLEIGPEGYLTPLVEALAAGPAGEADRQREAGMAYHLRRALDRVTDRAGAGAAAAGEGDGRGQVSSGPGRGVLALVGAAHVRRLAAALAGPVAAPLARTRRAAIEIRHLHPESLTALLPDPPLAHAVWERLRTGEPPPEPPLDEVAAEPVSLARAGLTLVSREAPAGAAERRRHLVDYAAHRATRRLPGALAPADRSPPVPDRRALGRAVWRVAERSYQRQTNEETAPWQRRLFFDFGRRLARVEGSLAPGVYGWVVAGRGVADDNLAWEVFEAARAFPWQEEAAEIPTASVEGAELLLPGDRETRRVRFRRRHFQVKRRPVAVPVRERATTDDPSEWLEGFAGGGLCSYPPEDLVVEDFGRHLQKRAESVLSSERERSEPFSTSLLDGVDVRETLRHLEDPRVWVRELGRVPGEAGSVVVIFDRDRAEAPGEPAGPEGPRYPYLMTWLGEHHDESDMAFYSTHPAEQVVGPGIMRATYGGFLMTMPPGRLFDVWRDPDYRDLPEKADVLLAAGIDYSEETLVVHVGRRPPRSALQRYAAARGKRIVHLPLGSLSPATLKKVRVLHVLVGHDKRRIAGSYVW